MLYWFLGYLGCGILFMFLAPLIVWAIDKYEIETDFFFEKSTYTAKWNYLYNDFPKSMVIILWPAFMLVALVVLPKIIKFTLGKKQRYIDYVNEKELEDREKYVREVERKYQNIMARERANDIKD